jgi:hypothetical protein
LRDFEKGNLSMTPEQNEQLRRELGQFDAVFIEDDDHGGYGVRRNFDATKVKRLETWEGEGGTATRRTARALSGSALPAFKRVCSCRRKSRSYHSLRVGSVVTVVRSWRVIAER